MARLIDADALANWIDGSQRLDTEHDYEEVARYIEECPTVDAVPVVRCRDCRYYKEPDDYCSNGVRKGGYEMDQYITKHGKKWIL